MAPKRSKTQTIEGSLELKKPIKKPQKRIPKKNLKTAEIINQDSSLIESVNAVMTSVTDVTDNRFLRIKNKFNLIMARLTDIRGYLQSNLETPSFYFEIKSRHDGIKQMYQDFLTVLTEISDDQNSVSYTELYPEISDIESLYHTVNSKCNMILQDKNDFNSIPNHSQANTFRYTKNLPDIQLPIFDGNPSSWLTFKDTYLAVIHNNPNIEDIVKYTYLLSKLRGDAKAAIGHVVLSSAGYSRAWELLINRFDNKRTLIDIHIESLINLPMMTKETATELRNLLNLITSHTSSLEACGQVIDGIGELMLINIVSKKIMISLRKGWENEIITDEIPKWNNLISFLETKCRILEAMEGAKIVKTDNFQNKFRGFKGVLKPNMSTSNYVNSFNSSGRSEYLDGSCKVCKNENHPLYMCPKFINLTMTDRCRWIRDLKLCINCFRSNHLVKNCLTRGCKVCNKKHHTLLHSNETNNLFCELNEQDNKQSNSCQSTFYNNQSSDSQILLSTAMVLVRDKLGKYHKARALLDSASQSNFITSTFANKLKHNKLTTTLTIIGLGKNKTQISGKINSVIKSNTNTYQKLLEFLVVDKISNALPQVNFEVSRWLIPSNIILADPTFNIAAPIDILVGAEIFFEILCKNRVQIKPNLPILQETQFGWIVSGRYEPTTDHNFLTTTQISSDSDEELNQIVKRFWEVETIPNIKLTSKEEQECEKFFKSTHSRNKEGRYTVKLPLKDNIGLLGTSSNKAQRQFFSLEKKLNGNSELRQLYTDFVKEYLKLGHMKLVNVLDSNICYYMPHHAVLKPDSSTTKLRVVFNASSESENKLSLNSCMMKGPVVQDDLLNIILRFRNYKYVITSDVSKMYRQINIDPDQTPLQRIIWRFDPNDVLETYELTTVTYGTAAAPFLATRVLNQLADDEQASYPIAAKVIKRDFYVDDCLTGGNTIKEVLEIQDQLINCLASAGFHLHKWASNNQALLDNIPIKDRELTNNESYDYGNSIKTLGLIWDPHDDIFKFRIQDLEKIHNISKRIVLSETCKLFDPLGLISPVIVKAKAMIQTLWKLKLGWDDNIPEELAKQWIQYRSTLIHLNKIHCERCILISNADKLELHGFADASQVAYGACIYVKSLDKEGRSKISLLCSKSRICPLKTISIPRLELMAAHLLSILASKLKPILELPIDKVYLWCDSTIVLTWIAMEPFKLKTFVANRVCQIQELTKEYQWGHVKTNENPADLISRGVMPDELGQLHVWWHGPSFINEESYNQLNDLFVPEPDETLLEYKQEKITLTTMIDTDWDVIGKFSSFTRLIRVTAYILRFLHKLRNSKTHNTGELVADEIQTATHTLVKLIQKVEFQSEIKSLQSIGQLPKNSCLRALDPFLDSDKILRVGGRLKNSVLNYDCKHPMILPDKHHFTTLVFQSIHIKHLHASPQLLLSLVRQQFWPIHGKAIAKKIVSKCIPCFKVRPKIMQQIMGQLPIERVTPSRPFANTGIDFCGPFLVKNKRQRNSVPYKTYVAVFVCFFCKAIHLEIVSDLSTEAFLAALKRFTARRGKPFTIWSDNGTNFVGADNELKRFFKLLSDQTTNKQLFQYCAMQQIQWKFIPPRAPNFGGLWEAAVKSFKVQLKKISTNVIMSFEELNTLIIQIEGILNSRPLTAISDNPTDPEPLSPGHFLIGGPITAIPEPSYLQIPDGHLSSWRKITKMIQSFWKRFSIEYIHSLQPRTKWRNVCSNLQIHDVVLLVDDLLPPNLWLLGIITSITKGSDGLVRVVTVKTKNGIYKRSISKISKLPL